MGFTFESQILDGCSNPDNLMGAYAGCHESYYVFGDLYDNMINDYHNYGNCGVHKTDFQIAGVKLPALTDNELGRIIQTTLRIDRNFDCCPLLGGPVQPLPVQWKEDIEEKVRTTLIEFNESDAYNANLN